MLIYKKHSLKKGVKLARPNNKSDRYQITGLQNKKGTYILIYSFYCITELQ